MPIINTISLQTSSGIQTTGFALSQAPLSPSVLTLYFTEGAKSNTTYLSQYEDIIENVSLLTITSGQFINTLDIKQELLISQSYLNLQLIDIELTSDVSLSQVVGTVPQPINPNATYHIPFLLIERVKNNFNSISLNQDSKYTDTLQWTGLTYSGGQHLTLNLTQFDADGPDIVNLIPASGSYFNNPNTDISFDIIDSEGSEVVLSSIFIAINGQLAISGGVSVVPILSGTASLTHITDSHYFFQYNPANNFIATLNPVVVSGTVIDDWSPANTTNFSYSFNVWSTSDLIATISGSPDILAPYIESATPADLQTNVPVNSNINIRITDDHTGLEPDSVTISINSEVVVFSGASVSASYPVTISSINTGRGVEYTFNPLNNFDYNSTVYITTSGYDRFTINPNHFVESYSFSTPNNSHLLASGLKIFSNGGYVDLFIGDTIPISTTGVDLKITYYNFLGSGISTSGSYIEANGAIIPATFVSVSGTYVYDVYFNTIPNFSTDYDLLFHVQEDVTGIFNEYITELLWGAEYCYNPDKDFKHDEDIFVTAQIYDLGLSAKLSSFNYKFTTVPFPKNDLSGYIIGVDYPNAPILGEYTSNNPYFEYGKTMNLELEVSDFAGNKLDYIWEFSIENKN